MACSLSYSAGLYFVLPRPFFIRSVNFSAWMKANDMTELGSLELLKISSLLMSEVKVFMLTSAKKEIEVKTEEQLGANGLYG